MIQEIKGNLFDQTDADAICILTNGAIKRNGAAVMGRGCVREAVELWPEIPWRLGFLLRNMGNYPHILSEEKAGQISMDGFLLPYHVVSFPTKVEAEKISPETLYKVLPRYRERVNEDMKKDRVDPSLPEVPGWQLSADPILIEGSVQRLVRMADLKKWKRVILPRPGCGNGELKWSYVCGILNQYLDKRFFVITKGK